MKEFYTNTRSFPEEHVFGDGQSSKFKNKYMVQLIETLGKRHSIEEFHWNFFALGHGKDVVDGTGGEVKSLVRQQVLNKTKNAVVQCASDFAKVCRCNAWCNCSPHDTRSSQLHCKDVKSISETHKAVLKNRKLVIFPNAKSDKPINTVVFED